MSDFDHRALARALRQCSPKCRKWLRTLPAHHYELWGTATALGFRRGSVQYWLRKPYVQEAIRLMQEREVQEARVTAQGVLETYRRLATSDIRKLFHADGTLKKPHELDDDTAAAVSEYSFDAKGLPKIKLHDKNRANDALAKFFGLLVERREVTGKDGAPLSGGLLVVPGVITEETWAKVSGEQHASIEQRERNLVGDGTD